MEPTLDTLEGVAVVLATLLAAISARQSARATKVLEREIEMVRKAAEFQLLTTFEGEYREQYKGIIEAFGPWPDPDEIRVDPVQRKVAHDLISSLMSVYLAKRGTLVNGTNLEYSAALFAEWLQHPEAKAIWEKVFRSQGGTWPEGFVEYVDDWLGRPSPWDYSGPVKTHPDPDTPSS